MAKVQVETRKDFQNLVDELSDIATVKLYPIVEWGNFTYIALEQPKLQIEAQTIDVIDITGGNVLRLSTAWPQGAYTPTHALVIFPHEGWPAVVVLANGNERRAYIASLPVQVNPPTREDARRV